MENKCEHCYCQTTKVYKPLETGQAGVPHKVCCNCGHKKAVDNTPDWMAHKMG